MEPSSSAPSSTDIPINAVISFQYFQERLLYKRLAFEMGMKPLIAMVLVAFWMWLENVGHPSFIAQLNMLPDETTWCIAVESAECLAAILSGVLNPVGARESVPIVTKVPNSPVDLRYLHRLWDLAFDGIMSILNNTCPTVFGDMVDIASTRRMIQDAQRVKDGFILGMMSTRGSATPNLRTQTEDSLYQLYNAVRSRRDLAAEIRSPTGVGLVAPLSRRDSAFMPYGEGTSRRQSPPAALPLQQHIRGTGGTSLRPPMFPMSVQQYVDDANYVISRLQEALPQETQISNIYDMQQRTQSDDSHMLQTRLPVDPFSVDYETERLSLSLANLNFGARRENPVLLPHRRTPPTVATRSSSSSPLLTHLDSSSQYLTPQGWTQELDVPEDERTLFLTFSNGYPVEEADLYEFFSRHWGGVETIHVQEPEVGRKPLYARAVFYFQSTCLSVLNGKEKAKFMVKGRHVWARLYTPKRKQKS